ncbi:hypothetical protein QR680_013607 [Steinernema hermaphroditum]|uniref:Uncharacterized protein n=1 Tax=Steinernema hermaphroditum TaxID=289476 RepID=A0AA39M2K3_9BILA|nr:hypothetical protein QR680_013607 [Steinernema hermaphroditum]
MGNENELCGFVFGALSRFRITEVNDSCEEETGVLGVLGGLPACERLGGRGTGEYLLKARLRAPAGSVDVASGTMRLCGVTFGGLPRFRFTGADDACGM